MDQTIEPIDIHLAFLNDRRMGHTPMLLQFFSLNNIEYIRQTIENRVSADLGGEKIRLYLTLEFLQSMLQTAYHNAKWAGNPEIGVQMMNNELIQYETEIITLSQRKRKQYERWMLLGDRMRIFPRGMNERTLYKRGENPVTQAPYLMQHPDKSQYKAFLEQVIGL